MRQSTRNSRRRSCSPSGVGIPLGQVDLEHLLEAQGAGLAVDQGDGVDAERLLQRCLPEQLLEQGLGPGQAHALGQGPAVGIRLGHDHVACPGVARDGCATVPSFTRTRVVKTDPTLLRIVTLSARLGDV